MPDDVRRPNLDQLQELVPACLAKRAAGELDELPPGRYRVRGLATVRVDCFLSQAAPQEYTPTAKLPLKAILAVALRKAGVKRDAIAELIAKAAATALKAGDDIAQELEVTEEALKVVEKQITAALPRETRKGAVKVDGEVKVVSFVRDDAAAPAA
jgi:hypothetical protein